MKRQNWPRKRQELTEQEKLDRDFKSFSTILGRMIQQSYDNGRQLGRIKMWRKMLDMAIEDIEKDKEGNNDSMP